MKIINKQRVSAIVGLASVAVVIASPALVSAATTPATTTINASIGSAISMTSSGTVNISLTPTSAGVISSASDTITVNTNNSTGYALTLSNGDTSTALMSGANSIAAHTGTYAAPSALGNNTWGYAVAGGAFDASYAALSNSTVATSKWAGAPSSAAPQNLKTTSSTATNDITTVWYGVKATSGQASGTYSDTVTYTATTNV